MTLPGNKGFTVLGRQSLVGDKRFAFVLMREHDYDSL